MAKSKAPRKPSVIVTPIHLKVGEKQIGTEKVEGKLVKIVKAIFRKAVTIGQHVTFRERRPAEVPFGDNKALPLNMGLYKGDKRRLQEISQGTLRPKSRVTHGTVGGIKVMLVDGRK